MDIFERMRQRSSIVASFVKLQNTAVYPIVFAIICVISASNPSNVYIPCLYILSLLTALTGLFSNDLKVFLVPAFMIYYSIGADISSDFYAVGGQPTFNESSIIHFAICLVFMLAAFFYKLAVTGAFSEILKKRGLFFWGIIFIDVALMLNGAFTPLWSIENFLFGLLTAVPLTVFYFLFLTVISRSENGISYACKALVAAAFAVSAQVLIIAFRANSFDNLFVTIAPGIERVNRAVFNVAWGRSTMVGAAIAVAIPAALYLARSHKFPLFYYLSAVFFWGMSVFIDTRSAIVFGGIVLIIGTIFCCIGGKNKRTLRVAVLLTVVLVIIGVMTLPRMYDEEGQSWLNKLLISLRLDMGNDDGELSLIDFLGDRAVLWANGLRDFTHYPIFGSGFTSSGCETNDIYSVMYHNIFVEFLGSMGLLGIFAFLVHLKHMLEAIFRRCSIDKLLLLGVPICLLGMSLLDNFFFYPNFAMVYAAFLACAEISLEHKRLDRLAHLNRPKDGEKPRVVFTYIEAGKGHIVPTRTVCEAFRAKYGDKVEIVESKFFTETNDPDMRKTEKLFMRAVKDNSRTPVLSVLYKMGNLVAGDSFAVTFLLSCTFSGIKAAPRAIKHMEELDAHLVYTAHWATPYYINKMHGLRPYTICFCPDVYSNGMFDVDCNNFLISSDAGERKISRIRMYAGGNITKIPFPARKEVTELRKGADRSAVRRRLGIDEDKFTVSLSDGGYGMARLGSTVERLVKTCDVPITIIALCGTNEKLAQQLEELSHECPEHITLLSFGFTDRIIEYIAASDLYVGKSGANSIAEPAALGVPIIVSKCATYVERGIKNYYVRDLKGAMYIPSSRLAANAVIKFARTPSLLEPYRKHLNEAPDELFNADASADLIWKRLCELGYVTETL